MQTRQTGYFRETGPWGHGPVEWCPQSRTPGNYPAECNKDNDNDNDNKQKCNQALKIVYDYKLIEIVS